MSGHELIRLTFHELEVSPGFADWLSGEQISIAITRGGDLCLIGLDRDGAVSVTERAYGHCRGVAAVDSQTIFLATHYQIWRLENGLPAGRLDDSGHDRLYLPQMAWTTGSLLVRDLAVTPQAGVIFVNGLFSCLSTPSVQLNFDPIWLPPFVSSLAPEDRCHLTGLCLEDGRPAFVTSAGTSDAPAGWREQRRDGGVVVAVGTDETHASGLSMPCSPVLRERDLVLCSGGAGELITIDRSSGGVSQIAELPGFTRGLALQHDQAIVGVSRPRRDAGFDGLPLADRIDADDPGGWCGVFVVDLTTGTIAHSLRFVGGPDEIQGLALLRGVRSPDAVRFIGDEAQELVTVPARDSQGTLKK